MATIRKRLVSGVTRWDATVKRIGAPRLYKTFLTRHSAETWARETEHDIQRGAYRSTKEAETITLSVALDLYSEGALTDKKSTAWIKTMIRTIKNDPIARNPLISLTSTHIAGYRDRRLKAKARGSISEGRGDDRQIKIIKLDRTVSPETIRKELALISRAIDHVRREAAVHLPAGNPATLVKRPKPSKGRERRLTPQEVTRLFEAAKQDPEDPSGAHARTRWLDPILTFALETGARRSEICNLQWMDVNYEKQIAHLHETKNGEDRVIPLSTHAVTAIKSLPQPLHRNKAAGAVFKLTPNALRQQWKRLVVRAGIENLNFHDLRHEAVSRLFERGLNPMEVSAISGHKTLTMLKRYTHLKAEDLAKKLG